MWDKAELRDTKMVVNKKTLISNLEKIEKLVGKDTMVMAVIKGNGYGHGLKELVEPLSQFGVDYLGVATLSEAIEIRNLDDRVPVMILGYTPDRFLDIVADREITQTIFSIKQAKRLDEIGESRRKTIKVHLKIDTGFHRLGYPVNQDTIAEIKTMSEFKHLFIEGIFSHLALAGDEENEKQFRSFMEITETLEKLGINIPLRHLADSIATVDYPQYRLDMVRVGALLYGMRGFHKGQLPVTPIMTLKTKIAQIHDLKVGDGVSYDYLWEAKRPTIIGTIPIGYADGLPRNLSSGGYVSIEGHKAYFAGLINMDQAMIDVTDIPEIRKRYRDVDVVVYGDENDNAMTVYDVARIVGTNKNDVLARIAPRVERVYIE